MYGKRNQDNRLLVEEFDNLTAKEYINLVWYKCQLAWVYNINTPFTVVDDNIQWM